MVSLLSAEVILTALKSSTTQKLHKWKQKMLGDSVQSQRKKALRTHRKTEQKLRQKLSQI
jgi:hypothetical protein